MKTGTMAITFVRYFFAHTVDCVGFANSCSAFNKPQAMNNINDCAISLTRACKDRIEKDRAVK